MPRTPRQRARNRHLALVAAVVVAGGTALGLTVSELTGPSSPHYRTATVTTGDVVHTLGLSATIAPVKEATADFQVSGTVASVVVSTGQKVTVGETLATLNTTSLDTSLSEAKTTLASAQAKLTEDEDNESSGSSSASGSPSGTSSSLDAEVTGSSAGLRLDAASSASGPSTSAPSSSTGGSTSLTSAEQAVVGAQHTVDTDLATANADLAAAATACGSGSSSTTTTTTPTTTPSSTTSTTTTSTTTPTTSTTTATTTSTTTPGSSTSTGSGSSGSPAACSGALSTANGAEQQVSTDQNALATAETTLAGLLSSQSTSTGATSGGSGSSSSGSTGSLGSSSSKSSASSTATTDTDTPEQLASDEATIDTDEASLVSAQADMSAATLVSPIAGTVETVGLTTGASVSAGSSTDAIEIVNWGSYEVSASLTTAQARGVKVGQTAQITVDGTTGTLQGMVTMVGPVNDDDSSFTYPVTVTVTSKTPTLPAGAAAQLTIDESHAEDVTVVPTSAVHTSGSHSTVLVKKADKEVSERVKVGLVGAVYTQITSGLDKGETVVLANSSESVPSSSSNDTTAGAGGFRITIVGGGGFSGTGGGFARLAARAASS